MQRLSNKKRKSSDIPESTKKQQLKALDCKQALENKFELYNFYNDIKFLQYKYDEKLQRSLNIIPEYKYSVPDEYHKNKRAAYALEFCNYEVVNEKIKYYRNLKKCKISDVKKVYMSSFNEMNLQKLKLEKIKYFNCEDCSELRVDTLELFDMCLQTKDFISILKYCKPLELVLNNIFILNQDYEVFLLNTIFKSLKLLSFKVTNSFLDFISFKTCVIENKIRRFSYKNEFIDLFYTSISPYLKCCSGSKEIMFLKDSYFEEIELLKISSKKDFDYFMTKFIKLRYLIIENLEIESGMIKSMVPVKNIVIEHCYFKNMCFYELIRKVAEQAKLIVFKKTELPLNCGVFLNGERLNCKVIVDGNVFIDKL